MNGLVSEITSKLDTYSAWRRDLHAHPELGFEEHRTRAFIAEVLDKAGLKISAPIGVTGLVATLEACDGPTIGLRADMDALPMDEGNTFAWRSKKQGVFHGCGHDGHTVSLVAAALALCERKQRDATIHFIFQPAEEGLGGGQRMIDEGLFEQYPCDAIFGFHNMPLLPLGIGTVRCGAGMASFDEFHIEFTGKGGHAGIPHQTRDCTPAIAEAILSLQSLVSRELNPQSSAVVSVTQIHMGKTHNVIEKSGWLAGTVRALDAQARRQLEDGVKRVCSGVAMARDVEAEVRYERRFPVLVNEEKASLTAKNALLGTLGENNFDASFPALMASEDFAFMLEHCPGAYILLGQSEGPEQPMVHHPEYDFNDKLIPYAAASLIGCVDQFCKEHHAAKTA